MDVIGSGGPLGSRQLLTAQSRAAQTQATQTQAAQSQAAQVDRSGQQSARSRTSVQSVQETNTATAAQTTGDASPPRTVQRADRAVSTTNAQNRENPLPRGSLVNILV